VWLIAAIVALFAVGAALVIPRSPSGPPTPPVRTTAAVVPGTPQPASGPPSPPVRTTPVVVPTTPAPASGPPVLKLVAKLTTTSVDMNLLGVPLEGSGHAAPRLGDIQPKLATMLGSGGFCDVTADDPGGAWTWPASGIVLRQSWAKDCDADGVVTAVVLTPRTAPWLVETDYGPVVLPGKSKNLPPDFQRDAKYVAGPGADFYQLQAQHAVCGDDAGAMAAASAFALHIASRKGAMSSASVELRCANPLA
jgi:hypothetical protein